TPGPAEQSGPGAAASLARWRASAASATLRSWSRSTIGVLLDSLELVDGDQSPRLADDLGAAVSSAGLERIDRLEHVLAPVAVVVLPRVGEVSDGRLGVGGGDLLAGDAH